MKSDIFDVLVAKDYESKTNGVSEKRVQWNRVGKAWLSKSGEALNVELHMFPNQIYVVQSKSKEKTEGAKNE
jgi:hypothetical protein